MNVVTFSNVRKELLLYLLDEGPKSMPDIRDRLDATAPEVSPRIKELMEHGLVGIDGKKYRLTPMGYAIARSFRPFVSMIDLFEQHTDFWESHDLGNIPEAFLIRVGDIGRFEIIEDDLTDVDRTKGEFFRQAMTSKCVLGVTTVFEKNVPELMIGLAQSRTPVSIIATEAVFQKLISDYGDYLFKIRDFENFHIFVSKEDIKLSYMVTDKCLFLSLCFRNGKFDLHSNLVSYERSALRWGRDLFEHYRANAVDIREVMTTLTAAGTTSRIPGS